MTPKRAKTIMTALFLVAALSPARAGNGPAEREKIVRQVIAPMMDRHGIAGMAVGVVEGDRDHVYNFGVMAKDTGRPVTDRTLFEIGSISKTFTATLTAYAAAKGHLSLSDRASMHFEALRGSKLDDVSLLNLATHTPGGFPLQFPDNVTSGDGMIRYFRDWKPAYAPGTVRTYANPSIGLLGLLAAKSMRQDFDTLVQRQLFPALGLKHSYLTVPAGEMKHYAQGYTKADAPKRMSPGVLASEAYGVRTTAGDMLRFIKAQLGLVSLDDDMRRAIADTHTGYFRLGAMTQDLVWEQYRYPVTLDDILAGNSARVSYEANPVTKIEPPLPPQSDVLINKTGSTNGFGAYVAFIPARKIGIVMLANKNYPMEARIKAAHDILRRLLQ
jgi:beta-lactamase class C